MDKSETLSKIGGAALKGVKIPPKLALKVFRELEASGKDRVVIYKKNGKVDLQESFKANLVLHPEFVIAIVIAGMGIIFGVWLTIRVIRYLSGLSDWITSGTGDFFEEIEKYGPFFLGAWMIQGFGINPWFLRIDFWNQSHWWPW